MWDLHHLAELLKEASYHKETVREQKEIIEQLTTWHRIPGRPVYIHPLDVSELLDSISVINFFPKKGNGVFEYAGTMYKQSVHIPARTQNIK
jgi:hypothetical protein